MRFGSVPRVSVSIHAPYAGSDGVPFGATRICFVFQSTPPMQGATNMIACLPGILTGFNPRPLCRERQETANQFSHMLGFQSTPPMQGATACLCMEERSISVSIHAPYAGSDPSAFTFPLDQGVSMHAPYAGSDSIGRSFWSNYRGFNPRPLCRERQREQSVKE